MNRTPAIPLRTARESLRWIGWDVVSRLFPFAIVAVIWAYALAGGAETLKLSWHFTGIDVALILGTGFPAFAACTFFVRAIGPYTAWRLVAPTPLKMDISFSLMRLQRNSSFAACSSHGR